MTREKNEYPDIHFYTQHQKVVLLLHTIQDCIQNHRHYTVNELQYRIDTTSIQPKVIIEFQDKFEDSINASCNNEGQKGVPVSDDFKDYLDSGSGTKYRVRIAEIIHGFLHSIGIGNDNLLP